MARAQPYLSRLLTLETRQQVPDGAGGFAETWVALGRIWAEVKAGTGTDAELDVLSVASVPYRITVRARPVGWPSRPRPEQRFRDETRVYRILAVADAGTDGRYLTCHTREEEIAA
ncbi:MAG: head-tail adaptor protein [Pseudomonadota bacterium]